MAIMYSSPRSHGKSTASLQLTAISATKILVNTGHCEIYIYNKNKIPELKNLIKQHLCKIYKFDANKALSLLNEVSFVKVEVAETRANVIFKDELCDCVSEITKIYLQHSK